MKVTLLSGVAALAFSISGAIAQNSPATPAAGMADSGQFISTQAPGEFRAPKLVGVAVYDKNNKDIGKISDLLLDKDGTVKAVVVGIGGFLGIGQKDVALPYSALHWQTEQRTVATAGAAGNTNVGLGATTNGNSTGATGSGSSMTGTSGSMSASNQTQGQKVDPAKTEAYQGYPDRAVIDMSQDQLKAAPEFKYAQNPSMTDTGMGATPDGAATTKKP